MSMYLSLLLALMTFISTACGGLFALKYRRYLNRILGFTAGILLGVVAFDLIPEIFELLNLTNSTPTQAMLALVVGFLAFHVVEKLTIIHHARDEPYETGHKHPTVGLYSALALAAHSFLDGVGIGLGFQVSLGAGIAVALAVIAHDFADGLNTVSLMLAHRNSVQRTIWLLAVVAFAPVLGALSTLLFELSASQLLLYLGFFAGFLLYIGASDILPEAHAKQPSKITLLLTILGVIVIFAVTRVHIG